MEPEIVAAMSRLVDEAPEIIEAHLPQVFMPDVMEAPAQVLVIVVNGDTQRALEKLGSGMGRIIPPGRSIDVWPLSPNDKLLATVRAAGCRISRSPERIGILRRLRR